MIVSYLAADAVRGIIIAVGDGAAGTRPATAANGMEIVGAAAFGAVEEAVAKMDFMATVAPANETAYIAG